jgi:hypothetical protein
MKGNFHVRFLGEGVGGNATLLPDNGDSPGTRAGYDYMVSRGKDAHLINFGMEV